MCSVDGTPFDNFTIHTTGYSDSQHVMQMYWKFLSDFHAVRWCCYLAVLKHIASLDVIHYACINLQTVVSNNNIYTFQ
jgi:hypothetical protein